VDQIFQLSHSRFSLREKEKLMDLPIVKDQEDSDQREPVTSEPHLHSERRMT